MPSHVWSRFRRFWWSHVRRYAYELCDSCGRPVSRCVGDLVPDGEGVWSLSPSTYWRAPDDLWMRVTGSASAVLCPQCFTMAARDIGEWIRWEAHA